MANQDGPRGATVVRRHGGGQPSRRLYSVDASNAVAIFHGHPVSLATDGNVDGMSAASDDFLGIVEAIFDADGKAVPSLAASTAGTVVVCDDQNAEYEIQSEGGGTALTQAAIGDCADFVFTHTGNANTGRSGAEVSQTLVGDGNSAQLRILGKVEADNNAWGEDHVRLIVTPNEHAFKASHVAT